MTERLARTLVFVANAAVLMMEILAGRLLAPVVGVTLETFTAIIGVVLAGISFGAWIGGVLADRHDAHKMLPLAFVLGGATAIGSAPMIRFLAGAGWGAGAQSTIVLAAIGFFAPAALLSSAPPMVVKLRLASVANTGAVVGSLSAIGTAGSLFGVFITGFVLIGEVAVTPILIGIGGAMVAIGLLLGARLRTTRRDHLAAATSIAIVASALAISAPNPCQVETTYFCARVSVDSLLPTGRLLTLDDQRHSYVDLADPRNLMFSYARIVGDVIDLVAPSATAIDVVHVGGGGFTLAGYIGATRANSTNTVLELDEGLVSIAEQRLGLVLDADTTVRIGDARVQIRSLPDSSADFVIGDAFGGRAVPWHLTTVEFLDSVKAVMRPDAVYAVNLIDGSRMAFVRAETATLRARFTFVAVIAPPQRIARAIGGNVVIIASDAELPLDDLRSASALHGNTVVSETAELDAFVGGASVLTDEYAPVDQLLG